MTCGFFHVTTGRERNKQETEQGQQTTTRTKPSPASDAPSRLLVELTRKGDTRLLAARQRLHRVGGEVACDTEASQVSSKDLRVDAGEDAAQHVDRRQAEVQAVDVVLGEHGHARTVVAAHSARDRLELAHQQVDQRRFLERRRRTNNITRKRTSAKKKQWRDRVPCCCRSCFLVSS